MGDINQFEFVKHNVPLFKGPCLEVGSRDYGTTQNLRSLFPDASYTGIDMLEGEGVDLVLDLTRPFEEIEADLEGRRFNSIFCLSVLEHCAQPFYMAENMTRLLEPGGCLFVSVPFAFKFHGYPSDYWRFTHEGLKILFPKLNFENDHGHFSTPLRGERYPLDHDLGRLHFSSSWHRRNGHPLRGISSELLRLLGRIGVYRWLTRYRYVLRPSMINMVGHNPTD